MKAKSKGEFKKLFDLSANDREKWDYVIYNQNLSPKVNLDNDDTFVTFEDDEWIGDFSSYLGRSDGVVILLSAVGILAEEV